MIESDALHGMLLLHVWLRVLLQDMLLLHNWLRVLLHECSAWQKKNLHILNTVHLYTPPYGLVAAEG